MRSYTVEQQQTLQHLPHHSLATDERVIVLALTFDCVVAERDALQQRLNEADQQIDDFAGGNCEWIQDGASGIWNSACGST